MTLKQKLLRGLTAGLVGLAAALATVGGGGQPGSATSCRRSIAIDPQVTASEASRILTFVVHTNSCAAPGQVAFEVLNGTAQRPDDFMLEQGVLRWQAGDLSSRRITVVIVADNLREPLLEDFHIVLVDPTEGVRIAAGKGQGRIFDDDGQPRAATVDDGICLISGASCEPTPPADVTPFSGPIGTQTFEPAHLSIALNQPNPSNQSVFFQTFDGGLIANVDYIPLAGPVHIPAGATSVTVEVQLLPHAFTQPGQSFFAHISAYTAGGVVDPNAAFTMVS